MYYLLQEVPDQNCSLNLKLYFIGFFLQLRAVYRTKYCTKIYYLANSTSAEMPKTRKKKQAGNCLCKQTKAKQENEATYHVGNGHFICICLCNLSAA